MWFFRKRKCGSSVITVNFTGPGSYMIPFDGCGYGVVFEDGDDTGYLYATNEAQDDILVALHLYDYHLPEQVCASERIFVVWNAALQRTGIHYRGRFQAVVDFAKRRACCRNEFPSGNGEWCQSGLEWDDELTDGLEFRVPHWSGERGTK